MRRSSSAGCPRLGHSRANRELVGTRLLLCRSPSPNSSTFWTWRKSRSDCFGRGSPTLNCNAFLAGRCWPRPSRRPRGPFRSSRVLHSLHAYFLVPGRTDIPIVYDVEAVRDGGSFSSRRVVARQGGKVIFYMSSSFHEMEEGFDHLDPVPEDVPPPEDCPTLGEVLFKATGRPARSGSANGEHSTSATSATPGPAAPW